MTDGAEKSVMSTETKAKLAGEGFGGHDSCKRMHCEKEKKNVSMIILVYSNLGVFVVFDHLSS